MAFNERSQVLTAVATLGAKIYDDPACSFMQLESKKTQWSLYYCMKT